MSEDLVKSIAQYMVDNGLKALICVDQGEQRPWLMHGVSESNADVVDCWDIVIKLGFKNEMGLKQKEGA